ncbi:DNA-binding CsgD family transcriptional regulator [Pseudomonas brassicacearum]|uniref:DNA-binding CsgD family transcriptional regulator n=1 Tax=Pseudomonas brassicacearum TaxID=930166 RepID=A0AAW8MDL8_9PSED|nr:LuxR family transcriptional regulator [Pseudomonas brassicacearum]MDR6959549.1 DNA-binding CsgD family transcriptional regulator [Pseudomonas brassicacearum]
MLNPISSHLLSLIQEVENNLPGVNKNEYTEILGWIFAKLGINKFAYVHLEPTPFNNSKISIHSNYPAEWVETYRKNSLYKSDPVMANAAITANPFFWDEIPQEVDNNPEIFDQSASYGIQQGYTVPIHEPGRSFGSLHLSSEENDPDFPIIVRSNLVIIQTLSIIANQHRPVEASIESNLKLSPREIEFLRWLALGKNYKEIGLIMNITERTVKFHAKQMTEKLDCTNVKQAMFKAVQLNLV